MGGKQITCMSTWKENLTGIYQLLTKMLLSHWNPFNPPRSSCLEIQWWKMCSLLLERLIRRSSSGNLTYCKSNGPTESNGMSWQGKEEICIISSLALIIQWKGILWEDQGRVPGQRSAVEQTCAWCVWTSVATYRTVYYTWQEPERLENSKHSAENPFGLFFCGSWLQGHFANISERALFEKR